MTSAP
jgi:hypothetical protein